MEKATDNKILQTEQPFKLICSNYPPEFFLDKAVCKSYFRQYGKVKRLTFKQKQRTFTVEYTNEDDFLNALTNAGEYNGHQFKVYTADKPGNVKRKKFTSKHKISYVDKEEINEELAAMGGYAQLKLTSSSPPKQKARPKIKRLWKTEQTKSPTSTKLVSPKRKPKVREKSHSYTPEQQELLKIVRSQAVTNEEKYRVLDARDKLLRIKMKKSTRLKSSATVGTCPDMCPEKERLMRETQHQIALYEQDDNNRHTMNPNKAVKQYSRSSADQETPLPHELRPVSVLQMTMTYLMMNVMDLCDSGGDVNIAEWYHFLWDRTRGIRKDITQQALCCQGAVELVEQCARFHIHCSARLVAEDPSVFDQKINTENLTKCLQTLKYMYHDLRLKGESCPNEAEFRAYVILLNLTDGNFMWEVQEFDPTIQKSPQVKFALQVYSAFDKRNYVKFFKLVKSTTYLNACILMRYFVQVRVNAVEILLRCFTPPKSFSLYPIKDLTKLLAFDDEESAIHFMKTYGMSVNNEKTHFVLIRSAFAVPDFPYLLDRSLNVVECKRTTSVGNVICGNGVSPERNMLILNHEPRNSFDNNGYVIFDETFNASDASCETTVVISDEEEISENTKVASKSDTTKIFAQPIAESKSIMRHDIGESTSIFRKKPDTATNIFAAKPDVKQLEVNSIFGQTKEPILFPSQQASSVPFGITPNQNVPEPTIFEQPKETSNTGLFGQKPAKSQDELDAIPNLFGKHVQEQKPTIVFGEPQKKESSVLFQKSVEEKSASIFVQSKASSKSIFAPKEPSSTTNVFAIPPKPPTSSGVTPMLSYDTEPKKGGFTFALPKLPQEETPEAPPSEEEEDVIILPQVVTSKPLFNFTSGLVNRPMADKHHWQKQLEEYREVEAHKKRQEEIMKLEEKRKQILSEINREIEREEEIKREMEQRRLEAEKLKKEEEERKRIEENQMAIAEVNRKKVEEARRQAEESRKQAEEKARKRAEAEKRKLDELERRKQREVEERRKNIERERTVKLLLSEILEKVDRGIREECLRRIRGNIKKRMVIKLYEKWRDIAARNRKKRKAMDCGAGWINTRSAKQCAEELHTQSQDLTLKYIKRYKCGKPLDIPLIEEPEIEQINMFKLTYAALRRRLCEIKEKWHRNIYWKVTISIPDIKELPVGLRRIEDTLNKLINWEEHTKGSIYYVENHKTVTYCIKKQKGTVVSNYDANGFVFIAKSFTSALQRRIFENLKDFGVYTRLPIIIVLEEPIENSKEYLASLKETGIVSDFLVFSGHFTPEVLVQLVQESMVFLAKNVERSPPLELDTLYSFLTKNLCTEIWKKASSFAKWNSEYRVCMRDPNVVISLYNEGVKRLKGIVLNEAVKEYAVFPEIFGMYLPSDVPDFLPCDYRYFPDFWTDPDYRDQLLDIFNDLSLPEFHEKWPPDSQSELFEVVSNYCSQVFRNPKNPTIAIYNILKENFVFEDDNSSLTKPKEVLWISVVETLAIETLKEQHLSLVGTKFRDPVFKTFVVVYNFNDVNDYISSDWFYRNNPLIESYKKRNVTLEIRSSKKRSVLESNVDKDDLYDVIAKAESVLRAPKVMCVMLPKKNDLDYINKSLDDLEDSIRIMKKVSEMNLLRRIVDEK